MTNFSIPPTILYDTGETFSYVSHIYATNKCIDNAYNTNKLLDCIFTCVMLFQYIMHIILYQRFAEEAIFFFQFLFFKQLYVYCNDMI